MSDNTSKLASKQTMYYATKLPTEPTNIIFTGIAGTGKTHQLLQIQSLYDEVIETSWSALRVKQLKQVSWCDAICAVLLQEDRMMSVPEMVRHPIIVDKITANERCENINQTLWVQLNSHAHPKSETVNTRRRSANYYFDKTSASQWYVLDEVKQTLRERLAELLSLYDDEAQQRKTTDVNDRHVIKRSCLVSFHQAYGYDEFVEGIRPRVDAQTGQMQYDIQAGAFLSLCNKAAADPDHRYAMLIDEINRANTAQVFGELMSVIEPSKRTGVGSKTLMTVRLAYSGRAFSVPSNVDIYATMNTQDYSLATLDTAFRRRFEFIACYPDSSLLTSLQDETQQTVDLGALMDALNYRLAGLFGAEAQLGHAYFMNVVTILQLAQRLHRQIIPHITQQIKLNANPTGYNSHDTQNTMLTQILYGSTEGVPKKGALLKVQKPLANNESAYSDSQRQISLSQTDTFASPLATDFLAVVNGIDVSKNINKSSSQLSASQHVFLTAKPYQYLYDNDRY